MFAGSQAPQQQVVIWHGLAIVAISRAIGTARAVATVPCGQGQGSCIGCSASFA